MRRSPRLVGTVGLLILALVVCAVLAYQAWDAARSQRETADNTLRDYARIADWQLTQQAKNALLTQETTPLEPGTVDHKMYVRGIGTVLEQTQKGGDERNELVSVTKGG